MGTEYLALTEIRPLDRPARRRSLYQLSYPSPHCLTGTKRNLLILLKKMIAVFFEYHKVQGGSHVEGGVADRHLPYIEIKWISAASMNNFLQFGI